MDFSSPAPLLYFALASSSVIDFHLPLASCSVKNTPMGPYCSCITVSPSYHWSKNFSRLAGLWHLLVTFRLPLLVPPPVRTVTL